MNDCMRHRRAGRTFDEIAALVGISKTTAHRLVHMALDDYKTRTADDVDALVALQSARLDAALASIAKRLDTGNIGAIETMLKIEARRARLLGLDAPSKVAPTTPDGLSQYGEGCGLAAMLLEAQRLKKGTPS